tara:strand:- start:75 stop:2102 length:2028 start_codon:yes stop_codon:yes gene_type:complete
MKSWNSFSKELTEKKAKRDYDGDGTIETGSKEHAGVVHNAIQRAKGKKADGQDTRKEEVEGLEETKLADKAYSRARDEGAQRRRTKEYKDGGNRSTTRKEKGLYRLATAQRRQDADLGRQKEVDRSSGMEGHMKKSVAKKGKYDYGAVLDKKDPKKNPKHTANKSTKKEEVEQYVDFLINEGYDCSQLTWEDVTAEYECLDEGLRDAVKNLLGKGKKKEEKKPESRGEQLRKKYNVGPDKSDTSAKMQILKKTRAKKERDQKEFGGSRYSKSVAKKSADAHDRYLKGGYSKYGADDARGKGNKARKRAEALKKEELELQELDIKGAVTGALDRGSKFMKKNPVGRAIGNVLKPVGSGRGTTRPAPGARPGTPGGGATTRPMMNSHEPEGDNLQEKPGDGYLGPTPIPNPIRMAKDAVDATNRNSQKKVDMVNKTLGRGSASMPKVNYFNKGPSAASKRYLGLSYEPEGGLVEGIRDEDAEKGTEERKKRLEKKRGHKVDDHPEYAKESATPGQPAEKLKTGRKMFTIPDEERSAAAARLKEKARKKREEKMKEEVKVETPVVEEAESKAQQRLMGLALSVKRGDTPMSSVTPQVAKMAREMKEKDLKDFAGTKHDGLPEKVKKEEPEVSSPLVESLVESAVQRMTAKARRETAADKRLNRQASSAQQRAELNAKK